MVPSVDSRVHKVRARLHPGDVVLRHGRLYQALRRASLTLSFAFIVITPLWHLKRINAESAGLVHHAPWDALARILPLPHTASPLLGAPWTVRVFGLEILDPLAALSLLVARGPGLALLLGVLPALLLFIGLGRFFCGWVCPYVPLLALSNASRWLLTQVGLRPLDVSLPRSTARWVLALLVGLAALAGMQWASLVYPPALVGHAVAGAILSGSVGIAGVLVGCAFIFDTLVSRAGICRTLCPGGALFSMLSIASPIRVKRDASACTDCTACDVVCNLGQRPMTDQLDSGCERCGKCVAACPTGALDFALLSRKEKGS